VKCSVCKSLSVATREQILSIVLRHEDVLARWTNSFFLSIELRVQVPNETLHMEGVLAPSHQDLLSFAEFFFAKGAHLVQVICVEVVMSPVIW